MSAQNSQDPSEDGDRRSLWERLDRHASASRVRLTPGRIAAAGVGIADAEGIDAVTMRRLASELGVAPMAAYRYVSGRDELLELMVDFVYGELELPDGDAGWREALRTLALRIRDVLLTHPWVVRVSWCAPTPHQLAVPESVLAALDGTGLDADTVMAVCNTVTAYVLGAVDREIGLTGMLRDRGWSSGEEARSGLASQMAWLMNTGRYPNYNRYIGEAVRKDDVRWQFETGLDCILDGIAARPGI